MGQGQRAIQFCYLGWRELCHVLLHHALALFLVVVATTVNKVIPVAGAPFRTLRELHAALPEVIAEELVLGRTLPLEIHPRETQVGLAAVLPGKALGQAGLDTG